MTPQYSVLVVVYNRDWERSPTLRALEDFSLEMKARVQLIVHDNSSVSRLQESIKTPRGFDSVLLLHDGTNHPLGQAYRQFIRLAQGRNLIFLDDDTAFTEEYLEEVKLSLNSPDGSRRVCVPQIFDSMRRLYSPSKFGVFSGQLLPAITPGAHPDLNAIMSGIALNKSYLEELGPEAFCVRTRLYGVDTMFMLAHQQAGGDTWVARAAFQHSLNHDQRRNFRESVARSWLEATGLFWTAVGYRRLWVPLLPFYLAYFMCVRIVRAAYR